MKRNKPLTEEELKHLPKGNYAHKHPNRRYRRFALRNPPPAVKPVDDWSKHAISGGHDTGKIGAVAGRESTTVGKQTFMAVSSVYGFFSRVRHLLTVHGRRVWVMAMDTVHSLFGRG